VQPEVERVAPEDVAHPRTADDDELVTRFVADALEARRAHLARRADRETIARDDEVLAPRDALAEVRHEEAERPRLPPRVERLERFGDAVVRRRDLVGVDRVELLPGDLRVPEDQRLPADEPRRACLGRGVGLRRMLDGRTRTQTRGTDGVQGHSLMLRV
jgi:hypothetical protein